VSGTITTDGTIGTLIEANITAWSFSVSGPTAGYGLTSQTGGATSYIHGLIASATTLSLPSTTTTLENTVTFYASITGESGLTYFRPSLDFYYSETPTGELAWNISAPNPPGLQLGGSTWIIATTATIPEPGTLTLALLGGACMGAIQWMRRCRRAVSRSDR
jgi:PEP-CTERM motif